MCIISYLLICIWMLTNAFKPVGLEMTVFLSRFGLFLDSFLIFVNQNVHFSSHFCTLFFSKAICWFFFPGCPACGRALFGVWGLWFAAVEQRLAKTHVVQYGESPLRYCLCRAGVVVSLCLFVYLCIVKREWWKSGNRIVLCLYRLVVIRFNAFEQVYLKLSCLFRWTVHHSHLVFIAILNFTKSFFFFFCRRATCRRFSKPS